MGGAAGSIATSLGSSLLGNSQAQTAQTQSDIKSMTNSPTQVGEADTLGMMSPFDYGNIGGMAGSSGNNAYNTAMSPQPFGLQDLMGSQKSSGGKG